MKLLSMSVVDLVILYFLRRYEDGCSLNSYEALESQDECKWISLAQKCYTLARWSTATLLQQWYYIMVLLGCPRAHECLI